MKSLATRFWEKVDKDGPIPVHNPDLENCCVWTGAKNENGYGDVFIGLKAPQIHRKAHRVAWELVIGPIPKGKHCLHKCDNPACVNPSHLYLGGQKENVRDMVERGRQNNNPLCGEENGFSKLTEKDVKQMRSVFQETPMTYTALGKMFGVTRAYAKRITDRIAWRHVV